MAISFFVVQQISSYELDERLQCFFIMGVQGVAGDHHLTQEFVDTFITKSIDIFMFYPKSDRM